jgi:hypothetical protein
MPDVVAVKVNAHAYCFTYNVRVLVCWPVCASFAQLLSDSYPLQLPELLGQDSIILHWETVSDIYLNKVRHMRPETRLLL